MEQSPPILRGGFRPFFLGAAAWAVVAIAIWLWALEAGTMRIGALDPLAWHRHEMLFGFVGAAIAGFALTAVPNWTGRLPIAGPPLAVLALWWLGVRLLPFVIPDLPLAVLAVMDGGFYFALALLIAREIIKAKNRNVPIAAVIGMFGLADMADYAAIAGVVDANIGSNAAIALAVALISLIGGRIVPSFTRNWMQREQVEGPLPTQADRFDMAVIAVTVLALIIWLVTGLTRFAGTALIIASLLQAVRLFRWQGWRTISSPIVIVLHLAYAWIVIGLLLLGLTSLGFSTLQSAAIHALTVGAMANMIVAVMSRAILGHTGRTLDANLATTACYAFIQLAVLARVIAAVATEYYRLLLYAAGGFWIAGFALFLLVYGPVLFRPRQG